MSMSARSPSLRDRIHREIQAQGGMAFSRFMELSLYDPLQGYYASGRAAVGREGDFFTSVSIGPVFGAVLAGQFLEMWEALGRPYDFRLVEQGANDGRLSSDILAALSLTPLAGVPLTIIEPVLLLREKQAATLAGANVEWVDAPESLAEFTGVHFSNELFDALPFDIFEAQGGCWHELLVQSEGNDFFFKPSPHCMRNIELPPRPDGFRIEIRRKQDVLLSTLSTRMRCGFLLAMDYGMPRAELLAPHRREGTLACYANHQRDKAPLRFPGEKDITAHVDFTSLAQEATHSGFALEGYTDQHHFLVGASTALLKSLDGARPTPATLKLLRSLRTLLHPETMGTQFKAVLFSKNKPPTRTLSGFQHAQDCGFLLQNPPTGTAEQGKSQDNTPGNPSPTKS